MPTELYFPLFCFAHPSKMMTGGLVLFIIDAHPLNFVRYSKSFHSPALTELNGQECYSLQSQ